MPTGKRAPRPNPIASQSEPKILYQSPDDSQTIVDSTGIASGNGKRSSTTRGISSTSTPSKSKRPKPGTNRSDPAEEILHQQTCPSHRTDSEEDLKSPSRILFPLVSTAAKSEVECLEFDDSQNDGSSQLIDLRPVLAEVAPVITQEPGVLTQQEASIDDFGVDAEDSQHSGSEYSPSGNASLKFKWLRMFVITNSAIAHEAESKDEVLPLTYHKLHKGEPKPMSSVAQKVWEVMMEKVNFGKKRAEDPGLIYILANPNYSEYLKIGRTTGSSYKRKKQWLKCKSELAIIDQYHETDIEVPFHTRVEALIKADLWNERYYFECVHCTPKDEKRRRADGGLTRHDEWFKIDKAHAVRRVETWKNWARSNPYDEDGLLRSMWKKRIDRWKRDKSSVKTLEREDKEGRRFECFLRGTRTLSWLKHSFYEPRQEPEGKLRCSRKENLCKYWGVILLFVGLHYGVTLAIFYFANSWVVKLLGARYLIAIPTLASAVFAL